MTDWKKNRAAWVAALREEDRKQTTGVLKDDNGQCCLGVLCEVAGIPAFRSAELDNGQSLFLYDGYNSLAPRVAMEFVGLKNGQGFYDLREGSLSSDNDGGCTFAQIADIIESEPAGLFKDVKHD